MPAYARYTLAELRRADPAAVLGRLSGAHSREGYATQLADAVDAWGAQVRYLQRAAHELTDAVPGRGDWHILLEYPIPRRAKRIDAVLLASDVVMVLEFKTGDRPLTAADRRQVEDYALDLRDFHVASRDRVIVPVLIAPGNPPGIDIPDPLADDPVQQVHTGAGPSGAEAIRIIHDRFHRPAAGPVDAAGWDASEYRPVPTIIEAAQRLYAAHSVREIARSHAGAENLTRTADAVLRVIAGARRTGSRAVCFVTGVPGAGKTLAGLNIVHGADLHRERETLGIFLSGNGPLVRVLTEALALDKVRRGAAGSRGEARRTVGTFVQNVHQFLPAHTGPGAPLPPENVVVFDEAQRAWDLAQSARKFNRDRSEPVQMFEIMDRMDWAVIVALVGNGQEINTGEAGLPEWGKALAERFGHWHAHVSPDLAEARPGMRFDPLFPAGGHAVAVHHDPALHLSVPQRSFRAQALADWVEAVLRGSPEEARRIAGQLGEYPLALTRSLDAARWWLRWRARGERRAGLVASSGGRRLRAHGLDVAAELAEPDWFLRGPDDVRSSSFLELVATEFGVQGLELDWTGLCWDADFRRAAGRWGYHRFTGTAWQRVADPVRQKFVLNRYRVLLTRAREGMVIWVPPGSADDATRPPAVYDETAGYLRACGVRLLDSP